VLPEAFPVSTAVGAVVGAVEVALCAEVHPTPEGTAILYAPEGRAEFPDAADALAAGRRTLEALARERLAGEGVAEPVLHWDEERVTAPLGAGGEFHIRTELALRATGRVDLARRSLTALHPR
jgi:hypothetical protein